MNNIAYIKGLYKPYRITKNKNVTIIDSSQGKFVLKKETKDLFTLFNYLDSRGFLAHPKIIKNIRNEDNLYEYLEDENTFKEQKLSDLANTLASLHNKTVYFKETSKDNYKEIYEDVISNLKYLSTYFNSIFLSFIKDEYQSPSKYLYSRNYYKIKEAINFCKDNIEKWYEKVNENSKVRVSVVHNNLSLDHFIENENGKFLISWDNFKIDTPVLDFVNLYHEEYLNYDFSTFLEEYTNNFELLEEEKDLLFILISIPLYFKIDKDSEVDNVKVVHDNVTYLYKTEKLIEPYYTNNNQDK